MVSSTHLSIAQILISTVKELHPPDDLQELHDHYIQAVTIIEQRLNDIMQGIENNDEDMLQRGMSRMDEVKEIADKIKTIIYDIY